MPCDSNEGQMLALRYWQPCIFTHYLQKLLQSAFYKRCSRISLKFENSANINMNAKEQIIKATNCDSENRLFEAQYHYINGMEKLVPLINYETDARKKNAYNQHMKEYCNRVEVIKKILHQFTYECSNVKSIVILEDSTEHTYESLMGEYFDEKVIELVIEDAYLIGKHQIYNLLRFMEMVVKKSPRLKFVNVITKLSPDDNVNQMKMFEQLKEDLNVHNILITFSFDNNLHDRKIVLSNGYIIKIGRGLDFYKRHNSVCSLGYFDYYYRKCKQTEIDIMRSNHRLH